MDAKRILFLDYDGVICDFWDRYHGLHADLCARYHLQPLSHVDYRNHKRRATPEFEILRSLGATDEVAHEMIDLRQGLIETTQYLALDSLFPGTTEALQTLSVRFRLILVTARKDRPGLESQIRLSGIGRFFEELLLSDKHPKEALMRGYAPAVAMVGDTEADIRAGKALGLTTVGVSGGIRDQSLLRSAAPDHLVPGLRDVPGLNL